MNSLFFLRRRSRGYRVAQDGAIETFHLVQSRQMVFVSSKW